MKEIGYWAGQGRLMYTSLTFAHALESLAGRVALVGTPTSEARQRIRMELAPIQDEACDTCDIQQICVGESAQPQAKRLVDCLATLREDVNTCVVAGDELVVRLGAGDVEAQVTWLRGFALTVDSLLRSSYGDPLCATICAPYTRTPEPFDVVFLNPTWMAQQGIAQETHAIVLNVRSGVAIEVRLREDSAAQECDEASARVSAHASMRLGFKVGDGVALWCHDEMVFDHVLMQQLESIADRKVLLVQKDLAQVNANFAYHQITCPATGYSLVVPTTSFDLGPTRTHGSGSSHSIKLSRQQRTLLGLHAPYLLSPWWQARIGDPGMSQKTKDVVAAYYTDGKLNEALDYETGLEVWKALKAAGFDEVHISPLVDTPVGAPRIHQGKPLSGFKKMLVRLCDRYLGQAGSIHRVGRPYDVDEDRRIIRLSQDAMSLLGIEVMDQVVVSYGLRSVSVRVMAIDNEEKIAQMNAMSETENLDVIVGMPAVLRNELCLDGIGMTVEVRRDTRYLFAKTINQQFIPALGLFLTVLSIFPPDSSPIWVPTIIFVALLPFVAYSVLSDERSKVVDKK